MAYALLAAAFLINGAANILLKAASARGFAPSLELGLGLAAFAVNVMFYFAALRSLPLSLAYPVMVAGSFLLVNGYAAVILREKLGPAQVAGYALIILGAFLVLQRQKPL